MAKQNGVSVANNRMAEVLSRFVRNDFTTIARSTLLQLMSGELPPIDVEKECRYPRILTIKEYQDMYDREGIATRVVSIYPEESWAMYPEIYETEDLKDKTQFEEEWEELDGTLHVLTHLQTVDEVSGIGAYGILLLGFDDGLELDQPIPGVRDGGIRDARFKKLKLLYMRALSQSFVQVAEYEDDQKNPRFGQPRYYNITFVSWKAVTPDVSGAVPPATQTKVHWTRVLHVADNRKHSDIFGVPRLQNTYNEIWNIKKILGANGQGYWNGGVPGLSLETQPGLEGDLDKEKTKEEVQNYILGLQRYLALEGMTAKSLAIQVADPRPHFETHLEAISVAIGVPMRVFKGTEEGKLASSQDMRTWNKRLMKRQVFYINPYIVKPLLERLFLVGVLTRPKTLVIKWPDLNAPTENDRATTAQKITDALMKYVSSGAANLMGPKEYLTIVLGFPLPQVEAILKAVGGKIKKLDQLAQAKVPGKSKKQGVGDGAGPSG